MIFIYYNSKIEKQAQKLAAELQSKNINVWLDTWEVLPGDSLEKKLSTALENANLLLLLQSSKAMLSDDTCNEIDAAIKKENSSKNRFLIVNLDELPTSHKISPVDTLTLTTDQSNINDLVDKIFQQQKTPSPKLMDSINIKNIVTSVQKDRENRKGAGYSITTILSIITLFVSIASSIPSFYNAFANKSKVFYSVSVNRMFVPREIDQAGFQLLLQQNKVPTVTIRVDLINNGDAVAREINVGLKTAQKIEYIQTDPPQQPDPVWVDIETQPPSADTPEYAAFVFKNLIPTKRIAALAGYFSTDEEEETPQVDVVFDDKPAIQVDDIDEAPQWSLWQVFKLPLQILGIGLAITLIIGIIAVLRSNIQLQKSILLIARDLHPGIARLARFLLQPTQSRK